MYISGCILFYIVHGIKDKANSTHSVYEHTGEDRGGSYRVHSRVTPSKLTYVTVSNLIL